MTQAKFVGSLLVVIICYFGAVLPIWRWAQPINYVSFWIVFLGILGGIVGLLIWRPGMGDFPAFTTFNVAGFGPLWPMLVCDHRLRRDLRLAQPGLLLRHGPPAREGRRTPCTSAAAPCSWRCSSPSSPS